MGALPQMRERQVDAAAPQTSLDAWRQLAAARREAEQAYVAARQLVYDRLPVGPVDRRHLSAEQAAVLARLDEAEQRVEELKLAAHLSGPDRVIRLDEPFEGA